MKILKAAWDFLTSRNTGIILLIVVSLFLMIGAALPNPALMFPAEADRLKSDSPFLFWLGENFNSMKVGRGYVFGVIGILLVVSTTFCSIDRLIARKKSLRAVLPELPSDKKGIAVEFSNEAVEDELIALLKKGRWKVGRFPEGLQGREDRFITARKGDVGFWGSVFFHAVLITLIAGLVVYYFSGFYATMVFTEGQDLRLTEANLSRIERKPLFGIRLPDLNLMFNSFTAEYYDDRTATDYAADFDITDLRAGRTWKQILKVNEPFRYGGIDFLMIQQGYSPGFVLYKNGISVFKSYVALNYDFENKDSFTIEEEGLVITAQFFADMARRDDGGIYSKSNRPKNPHFGLDIAKRGERVFRGLVGRGGEVFFGEYRLEFHDLRHWITLNLVRETGIGFFFVCSMIGLAGVLVRVLDPERKVFVMVQDYPGGKRVTFYPYSKHFEGMLGESINDIINELRRRETAGNRNVGS